jgi:hypothetical protein
VSNVAANVAASAIPPSAAPIIQLDPVTQSRLRAQMMPADQRALLAKIAAAASQEMTAAGVRHCLAGAALEGVVASGAIPPWAERIDFVVEDMDAVLAAPGGETKTLRDRFAARGLQFAADDGSARVGLAEFAARCRIEKGPVGVVALMAVLDAEAARMLDKEAALRLPVPLDAVQRAARSADWPTHVTLPSVGRVERRVAQQEADAVDALARIFSKAAAAIEMSIRAAELGAPPPT